MLDTSYILFDEMQSFEHARAQQRTIALAAQHKPRPILSIQVGKITVKGDLAKAGEALVRGPHLSLSCCNAALAQTGLAAKLICTVANDAGRRGFRIGQKPSNRHATQAI